MNTHASTLQHARIALIALSAALWWPAQAASPEPTAVAALQGKAEVGKGLLKVWGFEVYDASLWAAPGFDAQRFPQQRLGLELHYLRKFDGADIAQRSVDEMNAIAPLEPATAQRWLQAMSQLFPNVKPGDRILGVHQPGEGAHFYLNGQLLGAIADPAFSTRFFGIWLSPKTSQPRLRDALIAQSRR